MASDSDMVSKLILIDILGSSDVFDEASNPSKTDIEVTFAAREMAQHSLQFQNFYITVRKQ